MIKTLIKKLSSLGIEEIILAGNIINDLNCRNELNSYRVSMIDDARSAAFFAIGRAKVLEKPVAIFIDAKFVSNIYTAITEAFYQKIPVLIISIDLKENIPVETFLKYCVSDIFKVNTLDQISNICVAYKPVLVKMHLAQSKKISKAVESFGINELLNRLNDILSSQNEVIIYADEFQLTEELEYTIRRYSPEYSYGAISKYLGMLQYAKGYMILVIPEQIFTLDFNVFNSRYIIPKMKIIVYDVDNYSALRTEWLKYNNIQCYTGLNMIEQIIKSEMASLCTILGRD